MKFCIWGLSFKPGTDDLRESASIYVINELIKLGATVSVYDPKAMNEAKFYLQDYDVNYFDNKYSVLDSVDALILVTEWKEFDH